MLQLISFVGLDSKTNLDEVIELSQNSKFPLEFGVLYSQSRAGKQNRYPSYQECIRILEELHEDPYACTSIHLCGQEAIDGYLDKHDDIMELVQFGRVQLNFNMKAFPDPKELLGRILEVALYNHIDNVIVQSNKSKAKFIEVILDLKDNLENKVDLLFDGSGGFGREISTFAPPYEGFLTGYAGGIKPDNAARINESVKMVAGDLPYYLDLESGVRINDIFSVSECRRLIENMKW